MNKLKKSHLPILSKKPKANQKAYQWLIEFVAIVDDRSKRFMGMKIDEKGT